MKTRRVGIAALLGLVLTSTATLPAQAGSKAELQAMLRDLLAWWPGDYDTAPQVDFEHRLGAPPDGEHDRQFRSFRRVAVPHLGETVIYGEIHVGGRQGDIIPGQQVMYIIKLDEARHAIHVSGRRILNGPNFQLQDHTPERLRAVQLDPEMGGNCDFLWRREGAHLVAHLADAGSSNRTCTMVSKKSGQKMTWDAEWILTPDSMSIFDNGYLHDKDNPARAPRMFAGREDRAPEIMAKGRPFRCTASGAAGAELTTTLHDHGDASVLGAAFGSDAPLLQLLRSNYERADGVGLEGRLRLALVPAGSDEPIAQTLLPGDTRRISLTHEGIKATCQR
jgi:hypothetical protein